MITVAVRRWLRQGFVQVVRFPGGVMGSACAVGWNLFGMTLKPAAAAGGGSGMETDADPAVGSCSSRLLYRLPTSPDSLPPAGWAGKPAIRVRHSHLGY